MTALDHSIFDDIRVLMKDRMGTIIDQFEVGIANHQQTIIQALENKKAEPIILAAHTLKSSAANMGAVNLSNLAQSLEQAAKETTPSWDTLSSIAQELSSASAEALSAIRQRMAA